MLSKWRQKRKEKKLQRALDAQLERELQEDLGVLSEQKPEVEDDFILSHLSKHYMQSKVQYAETHKEYSSYKENPVQPLVKEQEFTNISVYRNSHILNSYVTHEAAGRGVNMCVDALADIEVDIKEPMDTDNSEVVRINPFHLRDNPEDIKRRDRRISAQRLSKLLNYQPNPYQSKSELFSLFWLDFFLYGNAFLYFDGAHIYHLKAEYMEIVPHEKRHIDHYIYDGRKKLASNSIIHIKDNNNFMSSYVGRSRLESASLSLDIMTKMSSFHRNFFKNSAIFGLVLSAPNILSPKLKQKVLAYWQRRYNPTSGGRRPLILDGGMDFKEVGKSTFRDLDFDTGYKSREVRVLKALGVPPILLESGNNANVRPNMKLFYELNILPTFSKLTSQLQVFFGWDLEPIEQKIPALQPEMSDKAKSITTLVNAGIITPNEGREELRRPKKIDDETMDQIRVPANIAGSAVNPETGGRPADTGPSEED